MRSRVTPRRRRAIRGIILSAAAVLVAAATTVAHAVPAPAAHASAVTGSGITISAAGRRANWCRAYGGGPPCTIGLAVEAADTLGETDYAAVCSGNCDLLVLGGFSTYMPLECAVTVRRSSADGLPTATWLGAARIGDWMTYGEGWYLIRVDDSGHGHVDRLGIDVVRSADANVFDGRCGAWNVPTTALLAGDFVIRSVKQTHLQAP